VLAAWTTHGARFSRGALLLFTLLSYVTLLQPPPTPSAAPTGGGGTPAAPGCAGGDMSFLFTMGIFLAAMYFLMIRPQQKRQKEHEKMLTALKKGDVVRTDSGIRGEIVSLDEREAQLLIAEKTKINILRSRIAGLDAAPEASEKK
jgi:preprotein translocase subunit YajC